MEHWIDPKLAKLYNHLVYAENLLPPELRDTWIPHDLEQMRREVSLHGKKHGKIVGEEPLYTIGRRPLAKVRRTR